MKTITKKLFGLATGCAFACYLPSFTPQAFAIEGFQISVQSTDAVLSWPSTNTETYIVQYRPTLTPDSSWLTLTDYLAASDTNITVFVHSNIVQYPPSGSVSGTNGGNISPMSLNGMSGVSAETMPMAIPANGSGNAVPLALYPVGFDLSGFTIFDPLTGESVSGNGYTISPPLAVSTQSDGIQSMDADGASGDTNQYTGFYRVVRDGAHIYGLTNNSVVSGEVQIPIEIAVNSTDVIENITFYNSADDSPLIGATAYTNSAGGWIFDWNTVLAQNGDYSIYAEVDFSTDDPVSSVNLPVAVSVNNTISFPNYFSRIYGSQMWLYAETIPNAPYQIDLYDEETNYLGTFSDYADASGVISFLWDLTDGNGYTFDSTNFYGVFTVTLSSQNMQPTSLTKAGSLVSSSSFKQLGQKNLTLKNGPQLNADSTSASATQTWAKEVNSWWGYGDKFVVAYAPLTDPTTDPNTSYKEAQMMIGGPGGEYGGVVSALSQYGLAYQLSPGNVAQSSAFELSNGTDRTNLLNYLSDYSYRNFYFFGHGNPSVIAGITPNSAINKYTIAKRLGNFLWGKKPENFHPYRFVFIDGCDVGKGNFCEALGIPAQTLNNQYFATAGVRSRAFLGYKKSVSFNTAQWDWRSIMLGTFFEQWQANTPLSQCVYNAQQATYQPMDTSAIIYGAADLQKNSP